jgi:hypothetical protein
VSENSAFAPSFSQHDIDSISRTARRLVPGCTIERRSGRCSDILCVIPREGCLAAFCIGLDADGLYHAFYAGGRGIAEGRRLADVLAGVEAAVPRPHPVVPAALLTQPVGTH